MRLVNLQIFHLVLVVLVAWNPCSSLAASPHEIHFQAVGKTMGLPPALLLAIARHESGMNPWAVNIQGRSYMPKSRAEALRLANQAWQQNRSFDLGLMQVNSYWLRRLGLKPEQILDPEVNITIGAWILAHEIKRHGLNWRAVASYHTPLAKNPERGRRYALAIVSQLQTMK